MQVVCPHCGEPISSENINIQRMAAVCSNCHTVFGFDPADAKAKHRKVKEPPRIMSEETDAHLSLAFRTNFRLGKNETLLSTAMLSVVFTFVTAILVSQSLANQKSLFISLGFGLFTLLLYYGLGLIAYNKTHIEIDDTAIQVSRKPLPNFLSPTTRIGLANVARITYEETAASKKEGYDTPRYHVWAETVDGSRKLIVGDVVEEYAVYLAQRLNEYLDQDAEVDESRLEDEVVVADAGEVGDAVEGSKSSVR